MATFTESGHVQLTRDVDLVYSPDDEDASGKGYYLHRYKPTDATSQLFATGDEAIVALKDGKVEWEA
jgi:hypothetical protein